MGQGDGDTLGGGGMTEEFIIRAQKRLEKYEGFVDKNRTPTGRISAKIKEEAKVFTGDILKLAGQLGVTEGKVSMFSPRYGVTGRLSVDTNIISGSSTHHRNTATMCGPRLSALPRTTS